MGTVRRALQDLVSMGSVVTFGDPAADPDGEPDRRGAAWLLIQVGVAALVLALALLVRAALGGGDGTVPLWIWTVPALLLVLPFVGHVLARPTRPVLGTAAALGWVALVVASGVLLVPTWDVPTVYAVAVLAALGAAAVLGTLSPAGAPTSGAAR